MPYDANGIYSRVHRWQDDRDNGIRILANRHDEEDDSLAGALNQAFLRSGVVPMTGPMVMNGNAVSQIRAGTPLQPGMTFELDVDTGFFQPSAGQLAVSVNGVQKGLWTDNGLDVAGNITVNGINIGSGGGTIGDNIDIPGYLKVGGTSTFTGGVTGPLTVHGSTNTDNLNFNGSPGFSIGSATDGSQDAIIGLDVGDYFQYHRASNELYIIINGSLPVRVAQSNVYVNGGIHATTTIALDTGGIGGVSLNNGGAANSGYVSFMSTDGTRKGYIGYMVLPNGSITYQNDGGGGHDFQQVVNARAGLYSNGDISTAANFHGNGVYGVYLKSSGDINATGNIYSENGAFYPASVSTGSGMWIGVGGGGARILNWAPNWWQQWDVPTGRWSVMQAGVEALGIDGPGNGYFKHALDVSLGLTTHDLSTFRGVGNSAGIRVINNNIGHDFRVICKDDAHFYITNETQGWAYLQFYHDQNTCLFSATAVHQGAMYVQGGATWQNCGAVFSGANNGITIMNRSSGGDNWQFYNDANVYRMWISSGGDRLQFDVSKCYPIQDRSYTLGWPGLRWDQVYCASSSMNTSDAREKDWRGSLNAAELAASKALSKEIGIYRWLRDITKDGDAAKLQCGILAQKVIEIFTANGLDALAYGFVAHETWEATTYNDADMKEQTNPAGDRYFIMFPDLIAFITVGIDQRLTALGG